MANPMPVVIRASDASVSIRDSRLLEGVSFECCEGEWTLVYGPSGAGKSTLLRAVNGLVRPTRGRISILGSEIPGRSRREARAAWRQTGTVLQEVALFETRTVRENVALALCNRSSDATSTAKRAEEWLECLKVGDKTEDYPCSLSGGERQRVALARAFAACPRLLILDEPTSALDRETARIVLEVVKELVEQGTTVLMSSHRIDEVFEICDQRIALANGRVANMERRLTSAIRPAA